ncbi:carbohydrate ABC transporter permease [Micromonospora eburnea]|uniref:Carbohydrate ABC transporter membrane protein 1, CUT1 family n=2 Tax=Micromonospora eburnea TaxID=227316 RepID=A0A1C6U9Z4_9ACTN|nr:sugar ABC transporter permease [Micromonospora eburnea]SCL50915.1 carbohydrate ABC transporter membrane protein 1, CUT1 family [Micromonospora eburnea]
MVTNTAERAQTPQRGARSVNRRRGRGKLSPFIERNGAYLFLFPAIAYLAIFTVFPLVRGVLLSFTATKLVNPSGGRSVGLDNYDYLLASDKFWASVGTTLLYTLFTVVFAVGIGTAAALLLNKAFRGRGIVRAIATVPWAVPTVAAALIFVWIYNNEQGILNRSTTALGFGQHGWLVDPRYGLLSVTLATVWKLTPLVMLVMLSALQSVPHELREATWVDGASPLQSFRAVTLPHIMPTIRVITLLMTIWSIRRFEIIFLITGGGPLDKTNTLVVNVYRTAFQDQNLGRAAAIGALGLVLSLLVTAVYFVVEQIQERQESQR